MTDGHCECGASMLFIEQVEPDPGNPRIGLVVSSIWWCPRHGFWRIYVDQRRERVLGKGLGVLPPRGVLSAFTLATYWRLAGPEGRVLVCELCRTKTGLEVRCGYEGNELLRSQRTSSAAAAYCVATAWKSVALEQDGFAALTSTH